MPKAVFYVNGVQASSAKIGDTIVFDVPGFQQIWLTQYQNSSLQVDTIEAVPTSPLLLTDPPDVGLFTGVVYEVINGQKGNVLDSYTFLISPKDTGSGQGTPPPVNNSGALGGSTCSSGLCTSTPPPPVQVTTVPVPINSGTVSGTPTPTPSGGGGLNPFGGLPGEGGPPATAGTGGPGQGTSGATPEPSTATTFSLSGFTKSPLFWLLVVLLALVYFMGD